MGKKQKQLQSLLKEVVGDLTSQDQMNSLSQDLLKTVPRWMIWNTISSCF